MSSNRVVITKNKTRIVNVSKVGPRGPKGDVGDSLEALGDIADVSFESLSNNDVLQYNSSSMQWTNKPQEDIVDGGNF